MITLNANLDKFSKSDAFAVIRNLMEDENATLTTEQKERLYKHFMPAQSLSKKMEAWQWVALACGKNGVREYLNYLYCDGKRLIGCDGHRAHYIEVYAMPIGYYCPKTQDKVDLEYKYPDIDRVAINNNDYAQELKLADFSLVSCGKKDYENFYQSAELVAQFNSSYIKHATHNDSDFAGQIKLNYCQTRGHSSLKHLNKIQGFNDSFQGTWIVMGMEPGDALLNAIALEQKAA